MTPRAWANALLLAGIFWASLIVALWLILAPKVGGVEAWHDSALPQGEFVAIGKGGLTDDRVSLGDHNPGARRTGTLTAVRSAGPSNKLQAGTQSARPATPSPSLRAVPRLAAHPDGLTAARGTSETGINAGFDKASASPAISKPPSVAALTGTANWYSYFEGQAAAGPALRVGDWRGRRVTVTANGGSVTVALTDACQCLGTRLIDLDVRDFGKLADPSLGLVNVEVTW